MDVGEPTAGAQDRLRRGHVHRRMGGAAKQGFIDGEAVQQGTHQLQVVGFGAMRGGADGHLHLADRRQGHGLQGHGELKRLCDGAERGLGR